MGFLFKNKSKHYYINWGFDLLLAAGFIFFSFQVREMMLACKICPATSTNITKMDFSNFGVWNNQTFCTGIGYSSMTKALNISGNFTDYFIECDGKRLLSIVPIGE
jgi:hypothetical protein